MIMASLFDSLGVGCEECGASDGDSAQGYKVVEQRHLCPTCANRLAHAILADVSKMAVKWPCKQHEKKEVELFCRTCQAAICPTCGLTAHSGHEMVDILDYFASKKRSIEEDLQEMTHQKSRALKILNTTQKCTEEVEKHFEKLREKLKGAFETKSKDIDDRKREETDRIEKDAEEEIRRIEQKRDSKIKDINQRTDRESNNLGKNHSAVSAELMEIYKIVTCKAKGVNDTVALVLADVNNAEKVASSMVIDCDSKAFEEKVAQLHKMNLEKLPSLPDEDVFDSISNSALKLRFKQVEHPERVGYIAGKQTSYDMVRTLSVSPDLKEPFLVAAVDERRVAVRDGNGTTLVAISIESGDVDSVLEPDPKRGIWDVAFLDGGRMAYSDFKAGQICVCDMNGELERTLLLPDDGSRFAYLGVDPKQKLLAATHVGGLIHVIDSVTGDTVRLIDNIGCRQILEFQTLQNGTLIVRSSHTDIQVMDPSSGETITELSLSDWSKRINCHVGADGMIYVIYRSGSGIDYSGSVGIISPDGVMRRQNCITFPTSFMHRYRPRCVVPSPGTVVILNGNVLLVYRETPGVDSLL